MIPLRGETQSLVSTRYVELGCSLTRKTNHTNQIIGAVIDVIALCDQDMMPAHPFSYNEFLS